VDHAHLAVAAALEMHRCIHAHREEWTFHGMPGLAATVGISTGEAVVGYVGSGERVQYTAIGSEVNVAARLEELSKRLDTPVLISQATYDRVKDMVQCRPRGSFELHNVPEPVTVYEVLGMSAPEPAPPAA
jgi:adenylate cyclase